MLLLLLLFQMELCKDLMIATKGGDEEEVRRLIEEGVDVNHQNEVHVQCSTSKRQEKIVTLYAYSNLYWCTYMCIPLNRTLRHTCILTKKCIWHSAWCSVQVFQQCQYMGTATEQWFVLGEVHM